MGRFNIGLWCVGLYHATICCIGSTMSKREQTKCSSSANECPAGILMLRESAAPTSIQTPARVFLFLVLVICISRHPAATAHSFKTCPSGQVFICFIILSPSSKVRFWKVAKKCHFRTFLYTTTWNSTKTPYVVCIFCFETIFCKCIYPPILWFNKTRFITGD